MAKWFYKRNGNQLGPVDSAQLKQLAHSGQLTPGDLIRRDEMQNWVLASSVQGLFSTASAAAPPHGASPPASTTEQHSPTQSTNSTPSPVYPPAPVPSSNKSTHPTTPVQNPAANETRQCPYCAETIKVSAKVCKHCQRTLWDSAPTREKWRIYASNIIGSLFGYMILLGLIGAAIGEFTGIASGLAAIAVPFSPLRNDVAIEFALVGALFGLIFGPALGMAAARRHILRVEAAGQTTGRVPLTPPPSASVAHLPHAKAATTTTNHERSFIRATSKVVKLVGFSAVAIAIAFGLAVVAYLGKNSSQRSIGGDSTQTLVTEVTSSEESKTTGDAKPAPSTLDDKMGQLPTQPVSNTQPPLSLATGRPRITEFIQYVSEKEQLTVPTMGADVVGTAFDWVNDALRRTLSHLHYWPRQIQPTCVGRFRGKDR